MDDAGRTCTRDWTRPPRGVAEACSATRQPEQPCRLLSADASRSARLPSECALKQLLHAARASFLAEPALLEVEGGKGSSVTFSVQKTVRSVAEVASSASLGVSAALMCL